MQNSTVILMFFLRPEIPLLSKFGSKALFKVKFGTKTDLNMQNSIKMFGFFYLRL